MVGAAAIELVSSLPTDSLHAEWLVSGIQFQRVKVACQSVLDGGGCPEQFSRPIPASDCQESFATVSLPIAQFDSSQKPYEAFGNVPEAARQFST